MSKRLSEILKIDNEISRISLNTQKINLGNQKNIKTVL
jgi:hypothetical protein